MPPKLAAPLEPGEVESLRARCTQQEEELSEFRAKLEDIQVGRGALIEGACDVMLGCAPPLQRGNADLHCTSPRAGRYTVYNGQ